MNFGTHPINLTLRFLLELAALGGLGYWGWTQHTGLPRWILGIGLPIAAAILWGTFAVPDDPSRSGNAPIPTPGWLRLVLELLMLGAGAWALAAAGQNTAAWFMAVITLLHYAASLDRITWLLKQ